MNHQKDIDLRGRRQVVLGLAGLLGTMVSGCATSSTGSSTTQGGETVTVQATVPATPTTTPTPITIPGTTLYVYRNHTINVDDLAWSPDSKYILSISSGTFSQVPGGIPAQIYVWKARTGEPNTAFLGSRTYGIAPVAWSYDGTMIAMSDWPSSGDGSVNTSIYDAHTGKRTGGYTSRNGSIRQLTWSPNSRLLAIAGGCNVNIYNANTEAKVLSYPTPGAQPSNVVAWSPDGNIIASAAAKDGHSLQFWNAHTGAPLYYFSGPKPDVAVWSPNGKMIATGKAFTQSPQVLDSTTGQTLLTCQTNLTTLGESAADARYITWSKPHTITWSPDSKYIAVANDQNQVQIWEVATQKLAYTYTKHSAPVSAVAWSPDGSCIASASYDKTVQIWQALA